MMVCILTIVCTTGSGCSIAGYSQRCSGSSGARTVNVSLARKKPRVDTASVVAFNAFPMYLSHFLKCIGSRPTAYTPHHNCSDYITIEGSLIVLLH